MKRWTTLVKRIWRLVVYNYFQVFQQKTNFISNLLGESPAVPIRRKWYGGNELQKLLCECPAYILTEMPFLDFLYSWIPCIFGFLIFLVAKMRQRTTRRSTLQNSCMTQVYWRLKKWQPLISFFCKENVQNSLNGFAMIGSDGRTGGGGVEQDRRKTKGGIDQQGLI